MSNNLLDHPFAEIVQETLAKGSWKFETPDFHQEAQGIEWRIQSANGISYLIVLYQKNSETFFILDAAIALSRQEKRLETLSWLSETQLTFPFINRLGERPSNHGGREIVAQCWSATDYYTLEGFQHRLSTFEEFCCWVLERVKKEFNLEPFFKSSLQ